MKDYLKEPLTDEERDEIIGIIWLTSKNYKYKLFHKKKFDVVCIENLELAYDFNYLSDIYGLEDYNNSLIPITKADKITIVNKLNILMDDLCLSNLKRALTFNEKLVFFFIFIQKYKAKDTEKILSSSKKSIYNWKKSVEGKIRVIRGGLSEYKI